MTEEIDDYTDYTNEDNHLREERKNRFLISPQYRDLEIIVECQVDDLMGNKIVMMATLNDPTLTDEQILDVIKNDWREWANKTALILADI